MTPFLNGFTHEIVKLGAMKLTVNKATGPAGPVAPPKPKGFGGGPTSAGLKAVNRQQMNFGTSKPKKPEYVPVGTQKFKPQAVAAVANPVKKKRRGKAGPAVDSARYETSGKMSARLSDERASKNRIKTRDDNRWFQKNTPNAGGKSKLSQSDQKRYDKINSSSISSRVHAEQGTTSITMAEGRKRDRQSRIDKAKNDYESSRKKSSKLRPNFRGQLQF